MKISFDSIMRSGGKIGGVIYGAAAILGAISFLIVVITPGSVGTLKAIGFYGLAWFFEFLRPTTLLLVVGASALISWAYRRLTSKNRKSQK